MRVYGRVCEGESLGLLTLLTAVSRVTRRAAALSADVVAGGAVWARAQLGTVSPERSRQAD